jgi:hypothetical protein
MTRQEQNNIILSRIAQKLGDKPNVQIVLARAFTAWFQALVKAGMQQMEASQPAAGGGTPAPEANVEGGE